MKRPMYLRRQANKATVSKKETSEGSKNWRVSWDLVEIIGELEDSTGVVV